MRAFLIGKFFAIICLAICTSEEAKNYQGENRSSNSVRKIVSRLEKSLKENRETGQNGAKSSFKFPRKKLERAIRDFERPAENAHFYPGSPGGQKYPADSPNCKNCVWSVQPGRLGEGARLRLDFSHPSSNCSCPNFRGSAEVLAGPWQLPPEVPIDLGRDSSPQTTLRDVESTTKVTKKPVGFFKGIQDFFKHSLHMDKTTTSLRFTTTNLPPPAGAISLGAAKGDNFQLQSPSALLNRSHEDVGKSVKGPSPLPEFRQMARGREATFNLRIKAVALPRRTGTKMAPGSSKRKPQRATRSSGNEATGDQEKSKILRDQSGGASRRGRENTNVNK